jgi:hypothetical protein
MEQEAEEATMQQTTSASAPPSGAPAPFRRPRASETVRPYASDWAAFVSWCRPTVATRPDQVVHCPHVGQSGPPSGESRLK